MKSGTRKARRKMKRKMKRKVKRKMRRPPGERLFGMPIRER